MMKIISKSILAIATVAISLFLFGATPDANAPTVEFGDTQESLPVFKKSGNSILPRDADADFALGGTSTTSAPFSWDTGPDMLTVENVTVTGTCTNCGSGGGGGTTLQTREGFSGAFDTTSSLSFNAAHFAYTYSNPEAQLSLDWGAGGPASLSEAETIAGNWVNTANPWADNEVVDTITASNYLLLTGGTLSGNLVGTNASLSANLEVSGTASLSNSLLTDDGKIYALNGGQASASFNIGTLTAGDNLIRVNAKEAYSSSNSVGGMLLLTNTTINSGPALVAYTNVTTSTGNLVNFRCDNSSMAHDCVKIDHDGAGDGLAIAATALSSNALSLSNTGLDHTANIAYTGTTADKGAFNATSTNTLGSVFQVAGNAAGLGVSKITHNGVGDAGSSILSLAGSNAGYLGQGIFLDMETVTPSTQKLLNLRADGSEKFTLYSNGNAALAGNASISGNVEITGFSSASQVFGAGLSDCDNAVTSKLLWDAATGRFSCGTDQAGGGGLTNPLTLTADQEVASDGFSWNWGSTRNVWDLGGTNTATVDALDGQLMVESDTALSLYATGNASLYSLGGSAEIVGQTGFTIFTNGDGFIDASSGVLGISATDIVLGQNVGVTGDLSISGFASSSQLFGSGLADCNGTSFLQWTAGTFGCGTPSGGSFGGLDVGVVGGTQVKLSSISFEPGAFNFANTASAGIISLDYTNGPASRSIAQTIAGSWTFSTQTNFLGAQDAVNGFWTTNNGFIFEGSTANTAELTLAVDNPGSDITVTIPATGTTTLAGLGISNTWTGVNDFGGATSVEIPNGTGPTVDAIGEIALDTTDDQLLVASASSQGPLVFPGKQRLWSATVASTSADFFSGGRIWLPPQRDGFKILEIHCAVDGGTSVVFNVSNSGGTTDSETITCDADGAVDTSIGTNPTYAAGSLNSIEVGTITGSVDYLTFAIYGTYTRE